MAFVNANFGLKDLTLALGFALGVAACTTPASPPGNPAVASPTAVVSAVTEQNVQGLQWTAVAIDGAVPVLQPKPMLRWTGPQQIVGSGGCNQFRGKAVVAPGSLRIGPLGGIGKACIPVASGQEDMFFKALENTRSAQLVDGQLVLMDEQGKQLARFEGASVKAK